MARLLAERRPRRRGACIAKATSCSTQYDDRGWRATFYTTGMEHSAVSATGTRGRHAVAHDAAGGAGGLKKPDGGSTFAPKLRQEGQEERKWKQTRSYTRC
jgi:hypothetical protein